MGSERLTQRNDNGEINVAGLPAALEKLAAYEGAEAEGRLVMWPCKVGDIVYFLCGNAAQRREVIAYYVSKNKTEFLLTRTDVHSSFYVSVEEMGKTVFLTCAEAEAALQAWREAET